MRLVGLIAGVAALYALAGLLGLQLAVPPGYATIMWPASGIAIAALLIFSPRLILGIFIGSLLINGYIGHVLEAGVVNWHALAVATAIAGGSSLQAITAAWVCRRLFGVPTILRSIRDVAVFAGIVGPLACLIAASVGTYTLFLAGLLPPTGAVNNWLTWWLGDLIGILVVLPLALLGPWRSWGDGWSRDNAARLRAASIVALMIPLGITFYGWKWTEELAYERGSVAFAALASDSKQALLHRLDSYSQGLNGAAGLFEASDSVSAADWRAYVNALDIGQTLPGINGMGVIYDVSDQELDEFAARMSAAGVEDLMVHPSGAGHSQHFIISYIEPLEPNLAARGLDISSENNRRAAAERARNTGLPNITRRLHLVQDEIQRAGFLLLRPFYAAVDPVDAPQQRAAAFEGWVYAPFVAERFMDELTSSQGDTLEIKVFDGAAADDALLIYSSLSETAAAVPTYEITRTIAVMGQVWTIVWSSTDRFDDAVNNNEPLLVLLAGFLVSGLFAVFLLSYTRREETIRHQVLQKTREIAAREQENSAVVNTAVVGILLLDESGKVLSVNEAARDIFGLRPEEAVDMSISDLLQIKAGQTVAQMLEASISSKAAQTKPASGRHRHGKRLDLEFQLNPWTTEDGQTRYTAIVRDVTVQHQITLALEDAQARWRSALSGARIGVFDVNLVTGESIVSDTWLEMLGFTAADSIDPQVEWRARIHPDDLVKVEAADAACLAGATPRTQSEYRIRHRAGNWIWLRSDASVTERDEQGRALRLVGTQTDISALKDAESALRSSEERLRSAIENAPIGMALIDSDGNWINVNEALFAFLGYSPEEFLELKVGDLTHPDDVGLDRELIAKLVSGEISDYQLEKRYVHKQGHAVWGLLSVSADRDEDGGIHYFIAQIQDIQHRKEMDRIKSEFISNVSHELRTPLTSIRGSLGLVMGAMAAEVPEGMMRLLTIAHKNSERLILLINDILDLEKMNSEKLQFRIEPHNLREEIVLAIDTNLSFAAQFDVDIVLDDPGIDVVCDFDSDRLQQVLSNLLSNAAKFSPRGGTVHLGVAIVGKMARVSVTDTGSGIPSSFRSRIFSPFSQADASATRENGGTGLGLHIAKQMMEKMAGSLDYSSVEGVGSTFWIDLPLSAAVVADPAKSASLQSALQLPRVLHVEDDADFCEFIATALAGKLEIAHAGTLSEARRVLTEQSFDLVLLDLQLPDGNGLDLLDELDQFNGRPVIVLTATETVAADARVRATLVKSRTAESTIVELILAAAT
tara:strand:- start:19114 stop:22917 length:3804 start_codon:yes stop_codon:yes gene_type:complete